jgi:hypothetical protein
MTFFQEVLTPPQRKLARQLAPLVNVRGFHLGGGTALALQFGHRKSEDLDFFIERPFTPESLAAELRDAGVALEQPHTARGTLHAQVAGVSVSFLLYRYPLLGPLVNEPSSALGMASLTDIAAMKLSAVAQRGTRKDFVDVYALSLRHAPLPVLLDAYRTRFGTNEVSGVLRGLAYYEDAEKQVMPRMLWRITWDEVKSSLAKQVAGLWTKRPC